MVHLTKEEYFEALDHAQALLPPRSYKAVVGVLRGGLIAATYLSYKLDLPLLPMDPDTLELLQGRFTLPTQDSIIKPTLLLVDDIRDSGKTIERCLRRLSLAYDVVPYTVVSKTGVPYYSIFRKKGVWVRFWYETDNDTCSKATKKDYEEEVSL